jgi:hypothetical protein
MLMDENGGEIDWTGCSLPEGVEKAVVNHIVENLEDLFPEMCPPQKKTRRRRETPDYWGSVWGKMLRNPDIADPDSYVAKKFRRRFRVPYPVFAEILLPQCIEVNIFDTVGTSVIPLELKILCALRILGRDAVADDCNEMTEIGESTANVIYKTFVTNFEKHFYEKYVRFPAGYELQQVMETYRRLGFPGAVGSIDCTHIKWSLCGKEIKWKATGKEGFASLSFEAIVTHSRYCYHVSVAFLGSYNDITVSKNDDFVKRLMAGLLAELKFVLYDANGVPCLHKGGYLISDNGYMKYAMFVAPFKTPSSRTELLWSEWEESTRKDVECFFGVLKARFWYLRNGVRYHSAKIIESSFRTAAILHNILLEYDGLRNECLDSTEESDYWLNLNPDLTDEQLVDLSDNEAEASDDNSAEDARPMPAGARNNIYDMFQLDTHLDYFPNTISIPPGSPLAYLRDKLVIHFSHQYLLGDVWWPKSMQRKIATHRPPILSLDHRVLAMSFAALYHKPSQLVAIDSNRQTYTSPTGEGLYSSISYKENDVIAVYVGEEINDIELARRDLLGKGGYCHYMSADRHYDCYDSYKAGKCMASYANSTRLVRYTYSATTRVVSNARISVDVRRGKERVALICRVKYIPPHQEILTSYQGGYRYPTPAN